MGHRYYDPTLGRFTQLDPSGQETNPYLYAGGDPINNTDPSGLSLMSFASSAMKKVGVASEILADWAVRGPGVERAVQRGGRYRP